MATKLKTSQRYPVLSFIFLFISVILSIISTYSIYHIVKLLSTLFLIIGVIFIIIYINQFHAHIGHLIQTCINIIDNRESQIEIIDGESSIAVLSSQIAILDTRMKGMVERLNHEQVLLKEYIEDISHQMKTPLTSMLLREEMLLEMVEDVHQKELVNQIYHQTIKMRSLIEDLLNLARIESHSIEYQKKECELEDLLQQIHDSLLPILDEYHVILNYSNMNTFVYCDEKWMIEALENIIKNCIEQKEYSKIDIYLKDYSSYIEIYIQDYGAGILEEDLPHIFERFYQGKSQKGKGVGIGLAMSKGIIDDHHGLIEVSNNNGALFKITLPHKMTKSKYTVTN